MVDIKLRQAAFMGGRQAFCDGLPENNPYSTGDRAKEWTRGYRNTRKSARFDATIKARKERRV